MEGRSAGTVGHPLLSAQSELLVPSAVLHPEAIQRIVCFRTDRLGETLLTLPALAALKATFPHSALVVVVHPDLQPLLARLSWIDEVLTTAPFSARSWWIRAIQLSRWLTSRRFDLAVIFNPKKEFHVAVWLSGIRYRMGYDRKWGGLLTHRLPDQKGLGERHEVEYNLDLVHALRHPIQTPTWTFPVFQDEQHEVARLLELQGVHLSAPFLVIHPWTSQTLKQWPVDRFRALMQQCPLPIVVIGGHEAVASVQNVLPSGRRVANLVGRLTLRQLAALLQRAELLISNDSGPVHLAAALETKTLVLFGTTTAATGPHRWGPWGQGHLVIWKPSMAAITVDEVVTLLGEFLRGRSHEASATSQ